MQTPLRSSRRTDRQSTKALKLMAALGVPTELRSRTLHHTGDLQQLANTVYSAYDFMAERLRALELWEGRLLEIVEDRAASSLRW